MLVVTDTVASIPPSLAEKHHIRIIPCANIVIGDQVYPDGRTLSTAEAYALIKKDPDKFSTSAIMPGQVLEDYRRFSKESREILHITLSSTLTAAFQSAHAAAEAFATEAPEVTIRIVDSRTAGGALGLLVLAAARAASSGMSLEETTSFVEKVRPLTGGYMLLDTLRYIYRTGRMSKTAARIASLMNIRPLNRITEEGNLEMGDRVRKRSDGFGKLVELIRKETDSKPLHFLVSHADSPQTASEFCDLLQQEFECLSLITSDYSPAMGYAVGPGAIFVGFQPELDW